MDGYKFKPVVIGKYKRPRCFKSVDMATLPVHYYHNRSSWMNQEIFSHWFLFHFLPEVREHYGTQTVILLLDNATSHPPALDDYDHQVEVHYLPPNTTALIQPMDMGAIYVTKANVKKMYYTELLEYVTSHPADPDPLVTFEKSYTIRDAIEHLGKAWNELPKDLLHKCFEPVFDYMSYLRQYNELNKTASECKASKLVESHRS